MGHRSRRRGGLGSFLTPLTLMSTPLALMTMTGCSWEFCGEQVKISIPRPSLMATSASETTLRGELLLPFPRGTFVPTNPELEAPEEISPAGGAAGGGAGGAPDATSDFITVKGTSPSAQLRFDRLLSRIMRSYETADGKQVVEAWQAEFDNENEGDQWLCAERVLEGLVLSIHEVTVDGKAASDLKNYEGYAVRANALSEGDDFESLEFVAAYSATEHGAPWLHFQYREVYEIPTERSGSRWAGLDSK